MNKRKMTSIALVAAVAISTVQLAYPADVFAHEQVNETRIENVRAVENNDVESTTSQNFEVSDERSLRKAIEDARGTRENPTVITVIQDILLEETINIPKCKNIILQGINENTCIKLSGSIESKRPTDVNGAKFYAMITTEPQNKAEDGAYIMIKNLKLDANNMARILYIANHNDLTLEKGATLTGGNAYASNVDSAPKNDGGAIYLGAYCNIVLNGGKIIGNKSTRYGGGISSYSPSDIYVNDVEIKNNETNWGGGGIFIGNGVLHLNGGEITGNNDAGSSSDGVYIGVNAKAYISGNFNALDNKIFRQKTDKINFIMNDKFTGNITANINDTGNAYMDYAIGSAFIFGADEYKIKPEDVKNINSSDDRRMLNLENNNLVVRNATKVTFNPNGGDSTENKVQKVAKNNSGETTIKSYLLENTFTKEGKAFLGWSTTPDGKVEYEDGAQISTDKEMTLYAKWGEAVATVNGVGYASVQKAIDKAGKEDTVSIIKKDIELEDAINIANKEGIIIDFHNANVSMKNATQKETVKSLINITNSKNIKIVNANLELSKDERGINVAKGSDVTVAETKFITDKVASEAPKSAILVEDDAKVTISGKVSTEKESTEGKKETFPVVELTDKTSEIRVDANSIINGHEIPSIGEVGTNSGSNDIVFDNNVNNDITLDDVLQDILGDKTNNQIVAKIVEETTTNSIKINTWDLGLKDEVYGIVETKNVTNNNRITPINGWKKPEGKFVTFDGLSSGKEYTIYIKGNDEDNAEVKIEKIVPSVKTKESSGGGSVTPSIPSTPSKPSKPVYTHKEVIGADRYETAAKVADELGSYDNVVLVNATSTMSDGLAASGLAGKENGAILLTKKDSIPKATMDRIKKVKKVYIIGGENAISQKVANQITAANIKVERIGGKNRVETSELVAEKLGNYSNAFIVNGFKGEADAMSASAIAARYEAPILLTNGKTSTHAKKSGVEYYVVGGTSVVNKSIADKYNAERLAGKDRYATNREVIDEFYSGSDKLYLANGETLVDALTASTIAKNHGIVLVNKKSDNSVLKDKNTVQIGGMDFEIDFDK